MLIIGCDYHPGFQQIALVNTDTGDLSEQRLAHREQAEQFYRELKERKVSVRVGMEPSGHSRWFERLLHELGFELWIGDPAEIRTKRVRKQKTDRQDAQLILQLLMENRFPRIWVPDADGTHQQARQRTAALSTDESIACGSSERRTATLGWCRRKSPVEIGGDWPRLRQTQKLGSHAGEPGHPDGVRFNTDVMIGHPAPSQ